MVDAGFIAAWPRMATVGCTAPNSCTQAETLAWGMPAARRASRAFLGKSAAPALKPKAAAAIISTRPSRVLNGTGFQDFRGSSIATRCRTSYFQRFFELGARMKIRPLHDRVIVKRIEEERKSAGGIVIPDTAAEKPDQGEIVAVGKGKKDDNGKLIPIDVKVGDRVLFGKYSGQTVKVKGDELLVMREEDIMGVIEGH